MYSNKLLINENPLVILPSLATTIGLNEAIVLQQVHYWIGINQAANKNERDGHFWVYSTYKEWHKQFPWWSERTLKRIFSSLEERGLLITGNFNSSPYDRTKWYRIDYSELTSLSDDRMSLSRGQDDTFISDKMSPSQDVKMAPPIPETTTETNITKTNTENILLTGKITKEPNPDNQPTPTLGRSSKLSVSERNEKAPTISRGLPSGSVKPVSKWNAVDLVKHFMTTWQRVYGVSHPTINYQIQGRHVKQYLLGPYGSEKAKWIIDQLFERRREFENPPEYPHVTFASLRQDWIVRKLLAGRGTMEEATKKVTVYESHYLAGKELLGASTPEEWIEKQGLRDWEVTWVYDVSGGE